MAPRRNRPLALVGLAGGLAVVLLVVTLGEWAWLRPFGNVLVVIAVGGAGLTAGLNGYWKGAPGSSAAITTLVAGEHLLGEFLRDAHAYRLPPVQREYYILVVGLAVAAGLGAHLVGRWASPSVGDRATPA